MEFHGQEYWSGLLFPTPGDLPSPGIEPTSLMSPALASLFFTLICFIQKKTCPKTHLIAITLGLLLAYSWKASIYWLKAFNA